MRGWELAIATISFCSALAVSGPARAQDHCKNLLLADTAKHQRAGVSPADLAKLRDIGQAYGGNPFRQLFTVSPDGRWISFQIHRADPETNSYCVGLALISVHHEVRPRLLDIGHELVMDHPSWYGWSAFHIGTPAAITPRWLSNGKQILYLKRVNGSTQVWLASLDGTVARQVTQSATDIDDFRTSESGRSIVYATRPDLPEYNRKIDREGLTGWRYDDRAFPVRGARPQTPSAPTSYVSVDMETGIARTATQLESRAFDGGDEPKPHAVGPSAQEAWIQPKDTPIYPLDYQIIASTRRGRFLCPLSVCKLDRWSSIWWTDDGKNLIFTRREGWANSLTGIYLWKPGATSAKRAFLTSDALIECKAAAHGLICLREGSREPRHFVKFDLRKGKTEKLFDPNPEFGNFSMGRVERLNWRNAAGLPWYGDLVYPVGYQPGRRYPMVVVQYRTKGFLRGGTGDEVPIQVFANKGFFVLSVDNLTYEDVVGRKGTAEELTAAFNRELAGRKQILSAIETAIDSLIARGLIAEGKIGITGLSDGCTTAQYAAINSTKFAAASVSGCGLEPNQDAVLGPMIAKTYHESGWPKLADNNVGFWSKIALSPQPRRVRFPVLFQAADNEFLAMVSSHTALRQVGTPSELFIFPGEDHIKSQPAHRLAVYHRNLAWFDFWLKDQLPSDPVERKEAERWAEMKAEWRKAKSGDAPED